MLRLGAGLLAFGLIGCSVSGGPPHGATPSAQTARTGVRPVQASLVRAAVRLMNLDSVLDAAEYALTERCMARRGFSLVKLDVYLSPRVGITGLSAFTEREARRFGFGLRLAATPAYTVHKLPPSKERALFGPDSSLVHGPLGSATSAGGCLSKARMEVYGSINGYLDLRGFENEVRVYGGGWHDSESAQAATQRYLSCMDDHHYAFESLDDAQEFALNRFSRAPGVSAAEERLALAHAACQLTARVWAVWDSLAVHRLWPWLATQRLRMERLALLAKTAVGRAQGVLGRSWTPEVPG
jgi:hypothetical protein